jgi:hypothetical protein
VQGLSVDLVLLSGGLFMFPIRLRSLPVAAGRIAVGSGGLAILGGREPVLSCRAAVIRVGGPVRGGSPAVVLDKASIGRLDLVVDRRLLLGRPRRPITARSGDSAGPLLLFRLAIGCGSVSAAGENRSVQGLLVTVLSLLVPPRGQSVPPLSRLVPTPSGVLAELSGLQVPLGGLVVLTGRLVADADRSGAKVLGIGWVAISGLGCHRLLRLLTLVLGAAQCGFRLALQPSRFVNAALTTSPVSQALEGGGPALLAGGHICGESAQLSLLVPDALPVAFEDLPVGARRLGLCRCALAARVLVGGPLAGPIHAPMISPIAPRGQGPVRLGLTSRRGVGPSAGSWRRARPRGRRPTRPADRLDACRPRAHGEGPGSHNPQALVEDLCEHIVLTGRDLAPQHEPGTGEALVSPLTRASPAWGE